MMVDSPKVEKLQRMWEISTAVHYIEGFPVAIEVERNGVDQSDCGYFFERAMSRKASVNVWHTKRFAVSFQGLRATIILPDGKILGGVEPIGIAREAYAGFKPRSSFGRELNYCFTAASLHPLLQIKTLLAAIGLHTQLASKSGWISDSHRLEGSINRIYLTEPEFRQLESKIRDLARSFKVGVKHRRLVLGGDVKPSHPNTKGYCSPEELRMLMDLGS